MKLCWGFVRAGEGETELIKVESVALKLVVDVIGWLFLD